jgi:hypothetical protein
VACVPLYPESLGLLYDVRPVDKASKAVLANKRPEKTECLLAVTVDDFRGGDGACSLAGKITDALESREGNLDIISLLWAAI